MLLEVALEPRGQARAVTFAVLYARHSICWETPRFLDSPGQRGEGSVGALTAVCGNGRQGRG